MKRIPVMFLALFVWLSAVNAGTIVMTLSDYSTGNTAFLDTETGVFSDNVLPHYQDARAKTDGSFLYILEGYGADAVSKYAPSSIGAGKAIYQYSTGPGSNPQDIVFAGSKAYLILNSSTSIWVVNPNAANEKSFKIGEIDISQWADGDGFPDAHLGFVYNGMVYVVLQRYDISQFAAGTPVLIVLDPSTDSIVDMDPGTEGIQGIDLLVKNPQKGALYGSMLYLAGTTFGTSDEGVMKIDLADPFNTQVKIISEATAGGSITGVDILTAEYGIVYSFDANWKEIGRLFSLRDATIGSPLSVPDAGGGAVYVDGLLYVGSRDYENPGLYVVNPLGPESATRIDYYPTELPPYSIVYVKNISPKDDTQESFSVLGARPNPFKSSTTVTFTLDRQCTVTVDVFNILGQKVERLMHSPMIAGTYDIVWDAGALSSGKYFIRVSNGITTKTAAVTLVK